MKKILKNIIAILLITVTILGNDAMILKVLAADYNSGELTINLSTDREEYVALSEFYVTVSWGEYVNTAGFDLNYDSSKVEFLVCSIEDEYINTDENGVINVEYANELVKIESIIFVFTMKGRGIAEFSIGSERNFATGTYSYICSNNVMKSISLDGPEVSVKSFENFNDYIEYYRLSGEAEELDLDFSQIQDLSGIEKMTNLKTLYINYSDLGNLDNVNFPSSLENLHIVNTTFSGTMKLNNCTNLSKISVWLRGGGDLTEGIIDILGLKNIKHLDYQFWNAFKEDYTLDRCIKLDDEYYVAEKSGSDLGMRYTYYWVKIHENLTEYHESCHITASIEEVESIFANDCTIKDISDLVKFTSIKSLSFDNVNIENFSVNKEINSLESLRLSEIKEEVLASLKIDSTKFKNLNFPSRWWRVILK